MGRPLNLNSSGVYAKLVNMYPASYRQRYGQPMVQTFDDMLEAEPSRIGKLVIWSRALWELPGSLLKEYVTDGKGIIMSRNTKLLLTGIAAVLLLANGASYWFGILHARAAVGIEHVTPTQLADAMQQDDFYSTYANTAVLFSGHVTAIQKKDNVTIATFKTDHAFALECQFPASPQIISGESIAVAAPAGSADRLQHGVMLHNCVKN